MPLVYETLLACRDPRAGAGPLAAGLRLGRELPGGAVAGQVPARSRLRAAAGSAGMRPKGLSHAGGGQAALQISHRQGAGSVSRRRRSRLEGKPAALPVLSAVASKA